MSGGWYININIENINPEVYLLDILDTTSRLNTSHGIETLYVRSSRHDGIIK